MKANLKTFLFAVSLFLLTGLVVQAVSAQPAPEARNHRREKLETIVIGKFATELNLTPEQAERFFPLFRQFREQTEQIQRRQHQTRQELDKLSESGSRGAPPAVSKKSANPMISNLAESKSTQRSLDEVLSERERNQQELIQLRTQFLKDVGGFLTPQQVSRCSIMLEEMPRKIHEMIEMEKRRQHSSGRNRPR